MLKRRVAACAFVLPLILSLGWLADAHVRPSPRAPQPDRGKPEFVYLPAFGTFEQHPSIDGFRVGGDGSVNRLRWSDDDEPDIGVYPVALSAGHHGNGLYGLGYAEKNSDHAGFLYGFSVDGANGKLTSVGNWYVGSMPYYLIVDGPHRSLLTLSYDAANRRNWLYRFQQTSTGRLIPRTRVAFRDDIPDALLLGPDGSRLYTMKGRTLSEFELTPSDDMRIRMKRSVPRQIDSMNATSDGRMLYLFARKAKRIYACRIDPQSGKVLRVSTTASTPGEPGCSVLSHDNRLLYVGCDEGAVIVYHVSKGGALTRCGRPFSINEPPVACVLTHHDRVLCIACGAGDSPGRLAVVPLDPDGLPIRGRAASMQTAPNPISLVTASP